MSSNLPAPTEDVKIARKWAAVESMGTLTMKSDRASDSVGILGACGRR